MSGHPMVLRTQWLARPQSGPLLIVAVVLVFLALATLNGNLYQPNMKMLACNDARDLLQAQRLDCGSVAPSSRMTALRDVVGLLLIALLSVTLVLRARQWLNIRTFLEEMNRRNILTFPNGRSRVDQEVVRCNNYFAMVSKWNGVVMIAALVVMLLFYSAIEGGRIYPALSSGDRSGVPAAEWWASLGGGNTAGVAYIVWGTIIIHVVLLQNIHGGRVVLLLWRLRADIQYGVDEHNSDGSFGWSEVRSILFATWSLSIIHGVCFGLVFLMVPSAYYGPISPLILQWVVATPLYILIPGSLVRRSTRQWKRRRLSEVDSQVEMGGLSPEQEGALRQQRELVSAVKVNPFTGLFERLFYLIGTLGSLAFVYAIVHKLY